MLVMGWSAETRVQDCFLAVQPDENVSRETFSSGWGKEPYEAGDSGSF